MASFTRISIFLILTILFTNCNGKKLPKSSNNFGKISVISAIDFFEKSKNQTIIDIRTPQEFVSGHLENAININYYDSTFLEQISKYDKSKPIFIYCRSGNRSNSASKKLSNIGFKQIYDLQGGITNWINTNHKIIK